MGKRRVSLGESGRFVKGKSEFPLRKVKEAEKDGKQAISGPWKTLKMLYIYFIVTQISQIFCHTEKTAFELRSLANERTQEIAETTEWAAL